MHRRCGSLRFFKCMGKGDMEEEDSLCYCVYFLYSLSFILLSSGEKKLERDEGIGVVLFVGLTTLLMM